MIKHHYNILSAQNNQHYIVSSDMSNKHTILIKELNDIPSNSISNIDHIEYDLICITFIDQTTLLLQIDIYQWNKPINYTISNKLICNKNMNTNKLYPEIIKISNKILIYNSVSSLNKHKHIYLYHVVVKLRKNGNYITCDVINNVKYIGKCIYEKSSYYFNVFTSTGLYVVKIMDDTMEKILICNIDFDYNIIMNCQRYGIITNDKYYVLTDINPSTLYLNKNNVLGNNIELYVDYINELTEYNIIGNIILINNNYIIPPKWCTINHKYFDNKFDEFVATIILCNKFTNFYRIPKLLLYELIKLVI